jgi:hypothetical protein
MVSAMPLAVTDVTNSRREILIVLRLSVSERWSAAFRAGAALTS